MGRRRAGAGFGTIEVIVALSLFSMVLVGIIGLMIGSISAGATAEASSIASNLARQRIEEVAADIARRGSAAIEPSTVVIRVPSGGRPYTVTATPTDQGNNIVEVAVMASYQVSYGSACAPGAAPGTEVCTGNVRTYSRTLQTRVVRP